MDQVAAVVASRYFVVGAMARDLVLVNAFGLRPGRATRDIDFGLTVGNWEQFQTLKTALMETGQFDAAPNDAHRLNWKDPETGAITPVDLIPFGGVASEDKTIAWPPNRDLVMNVAGFEEASESAIRLQIEDDLVVRVASIPGLTVLKLIAWERRRNENNKDAADLRHLLLYYGDAGNLDRLYEQEMPLLEAAGFDVELAGAQLLGRDTARICHKDTRVRIRALLDSDPLVDQLIVQMAGAGFLEDVQAERISGLLGRFCEGFLGD
ncbi:MAG: nucleotidyl transferase AbiEii/AbiGii toxin family protein [Bryobacteraceae bacterium]